MSGNDFWSEDDILFDGDIDLKHRMTHSIHYPYMNSIAAHRGDWMMINSSIYMTPYMTPPTTLEDSAKVLARMANTGISLKPKDKGERTWNIYSRTLEKKLMAKQQFESPPKPSWWLPKLIWSILGKG